MHPWIELAKLRLPDARRNPRGRAAFPSAANLDADEPDLLRAMVSPGEHLIRDVTIPKVGDAKGHPFRIDHQTLEMIAKLGNRSEEGIKSRLGHPTPDRDGVDWLLGRVKNFRVNTARVIGDLHFNSSTAISPRRQPNCLRHGPCQSDRTSFGLSIVARGKKEQTGGGTKPAYRPSVYWRRPGRRPGGHRRIDGTLTFRSETQPKECRPCLVFSKS